MIERTLALALWLGLAAPGASALAAGGPLADPSGFLQDYKRLAPVPGKDGRYAWTAPDPELRQYTRFMLPPMEIWIARDAPNRGLSADVVQRLAGIYQSSFTRVLAPQFSVADRPGAGVATCRFAITGVNPERPHMTPLDLVPIKALFNVARSATGNAPQVARVSAEIECEDSVSKKLLVEALISGVGDSKFAEGQPIAWTDVEPLLASWAHDFKARLLAVQGR
jgi:hypothetical protein